MNNFIKQSKLIGLLLSILSCVLPLWQSGALAQTFVELKIASASDWVMYREDGSQIAIVRTKVEDEEQSPTGYSIAVYSTNASLQPDRLIYEDKPQGRNITDFQWVQSNLLYSLVNSSPTWMQQAVQERNVATLKQGVELRRWSGGQDAENVAGLKVLPPGNLFADSHSSKLLAFDTLDRIGFLWSQQPADAGSKFLSERSITVLNVRTGTIAPSVKAPLPVLGYRWGAKRGKFVPLDVTNDGTYLIGVAQNGYLWKQNLNNEVPFVVKVNLESGAVTAITPDSELNGLSLYGQLQYYKYGNPMLVDSGASIVCRLSTATTIDALAFRVGYFDLNGKQIKEKLIFDKDLARAKTPKGVLLTWTPEGENLLIQNGSDVWMLDTENWSGKVIAKDVQVEDVLGWVSKTSLLVRAHTFVSSESNTANDSESLRPLHWGLISIPEEVNN